MWSETEAKAEGGIMQNMGSNKGSQKKVFW